MACLVNMLHRRRFKRRFFLVDQGYPDLLELAYNQSSSNYGLLLVVGQGEGIIPEGDNPGIRGNGDQPARNSVAYCPTMWQYACRESWEYVKECTKWWAETGLLLQKSEFKKNIPTISVLKVQKNWAIANTGRDGRLLE